MKALLVLFILTPLFLFAQQSRIPDAKGILHVKQGVEQAGDGSSWDNALPNLADALDYAENANRKKPGTVKQIWVAKGIYIPMHRYAEKDYENNPTTERDNTFLITSGIEIYGGFSGTEASFEERNTKINKTVLSGNLRSYHVITVVLKQGNVVIDGFTITKGNASYHGTWVVVNETLIPRGSGGGAYINIFELANIKISNNIITENRAHYCGGGIYADSDGGGSISSISDNTINNNKASLGGGVYLAGFPRLSSNAILKNDAREGGGVFIDAETGWSRCVENNEIVGNYAESRGGGILAYAGSGPARIYLTNNTIADNRVQLQLDGSRGGGVDTYSWYGGKTIISNTLMCGNVRGAIPDNLSFADNKDIEISHCLIESGNNEKLPDKIANNYTVGLKADDVFVDYEGGNFRLKKGSLAINKGDNNLAKNIITDKDGKPRIANKVVDVGAYEY